MSSPVLGGGSDADADSTPNVAPGGTSNVPRQGPAPSASTTRQPSASVLTVGAVVALVEVVGDAAALSGRAEPPASSDGATTSATGGDARVGDGDAGGGEDGDVEHAASATDNSDCGAVMENLLPMRAAAGPRRAAAP
jgi:hypothetical protein